LVGLHLTTLRFPRLHCRRFAVDFGSRFTGCVSPHVIYHGSHLLPHARTARLPTVAFALRGCAFPTLPLVPRCVPRFVYGFSLQFRLGGAVGLRFHYLLPPPVFFAARVARTLPVTLPGFTRCVTLRLPRYVTACVHDFTRTTHILRGYGYVRCTFVTHTHGRSRYVAVGYLRYVYATHLRLRLVDSPFASFTFTAFTFDYLR